MFLNVLSLFSVCFLLLCCIQSTPIQRPSFIDIHCHYLPNSHTSDSNFSNPVSSELLSPPQARPWTQIQEVPEASTEAEISNHEATTEAEISYLEAYTETEISDLDDNTETEISDLGPSKKVDSPNFKLHTGLFCLAKTEEATLSKSNFDYCGEDHYFVSEKKSVKLFGVADGVGGYANGVSRFVSTGLMQRCYELTNENYYYPKTLLSLAYQSLVRNFPGFDGGSTASIFSIDESNGLFLGTNFGDSGFLIIRGLQYILQSNFQTHYFNCPFQVSCNIGPEQAESYTLTLQQGDILILATDGLWDNLFNEDISSIVESFIPELQSTNNKTENVGKLAEKITREAKIKGSMPQYVSPFATKAKELGASFIGGKNDDTTVLVVYVDIE